MKGSEGLNDNGPELGGGPVMWPGGDQIDDRSPLVKYYQASFFMYRPRLPTSTPWYHTENGKMWPANDLLF